jgi:hypothetical protein
MRSVSYHRKEGDKFFLELLVMSSLCIMLTLLSTILGFCGSGRTDTAADTWTPATKIRTRQSVPFSSGKKEKIKIYPTCTVKVDLWVTRPRFQLCTSTLQIQVLRLHARSGHYNLIEYVGMFGWTQVSYCWTTRRSVVIANIKRVVHTEFVGILTVYIIMKLQISSLRLLLATDGSLNNTSYRQYIAFFLQSKCTFSRVYGSVTNNNGFRTRWLDLLACSCTIPLNHNQLQ